MWEVFSEVHVSYPLMNLAKINHHVLPTLLPFSITYTSNSQANLASIGFRELPTQVRLSSPSAFRSAAFALSHTYIYMPGEKKIGVLHLDDRTLLRRGNVRLGSGSGKVIKAEKSSKLP